MENSSYFYFMSNKAKHIFNSISNFLMDNLRQSQNLEYRLLKRGYILYQYEVTKQNKTFEIYVRDYLAEIHNFQYKTEKELSDKTCIHTRVSSIFTLRPDLIKLYFDKSDFAFADYKNLIEEYNTTEIITNEEPQPENITEQKEQEQIIPDNIEEKLSKVRAEILKYESGEKLPKHIGQRMFGYLLKADYINAYNDRQRIEQWKKFTGLDSLPEMSYLRDPDYNKNDTSKINQQLKSIEEFFYLVGLDVLITYYEKGRKK